MINVIIWSNNIVQIETKNYSIDSKEEMLTFLEELFDKVYYGGETVCLEEAIIDTNKGIAHFRELGRWK